MDPLITALKRIRRRLLAVRALEAGLAGAMVAAVPALVVAVLRILLPRVLPPALGHPAAAFALLPCGFLAGFVVRLVGGVSLHQAARAADRAAGLDDRLATALERSRLQESSFQRVVRGGSEPVPSAAEGHPPRNDTTVLPGAVGTETHRARSEPPAVHGSISAMDERLLADARRAADGLEPRRLPLAATAGRRGRAALVAAVVLAALAMVPSLGGPRVDRPSAERAANALEPLAEEESLAPAVRQAVRRAVEDLRRAGARRGDVERQTASVYRAAAEARRAREEVARALASAETQEIARMARAARTGNADGAEAAAGDLADRLAGRGGVAAVEPAERRRLGDMLDAAVPRAREGGLADLEEALADAARVVRSDDGEAAAAPALRRLAKTMVRVLGPQGEAAVAAAVDTVDRARRAMGLAAAPDIAVAGDDEGGAGGQAVGEERSETPTVSPDDGTAGVDGAPVVTVPDAVRPEDRDVVRRYFGG
ncbi:MAG: hypothetical protein R6X20_01665 [Phycisphaerae bacterium]